MLPKNEPPPPFAALNKFLIFFQDCCVFTSPYLHQLTNFPHLCCPPNRIPQSMRLPCFNVKITTMIKMNDSDLETWFVLVFSAQLLLSF